MLRSWHAVSKYFASGLPALLLLAGGIERRWIGDDGFINLRVVRQLLAGNGFVFNAGERIEAVTSPLWVFVLGAVARLGVPLEAGAVWVGLALSFTGLLLLGLAHVRAEGDPLEDGESWLPFGTLAYAALPAAWDYASSGLENGLGLLWLGASAWLWARAKRPFLTALVLGIAPVVRPDYALLGLPLGVLLLAREVGVGRRSKLIAIAAVPGCAYQIFRMGYFASVVPNTALAKEAFESYWAQGGHYLWNTLHVYFLWWPLGFVFASLLLLSRASLTSRGRLRWALCLGGVLHALYIVRVGGDFMHARLLLPGIAAVFGSVAVVPFKARLSPTAIAQGALAVALYAWAGLCAAQFRVAHENEFGIGDERGWFSRQSGVANPIQIEDYRNFLFYTEAETRRRELENGCAGASCEPSVLLDRGLADGRKRLPLREGATPSGVRGVVVVGPLGIPGAVLGLDLHVVDAFGLADPIGARLRLGHRGRPGHEKHLPDAWMAARFAAPTSLHDASARKALEALACEPLPSLLQAVREPMSARRFFENVALAVRLRNTRLSGDPAQAQRELCAL